MPIYAYGLFWHADAVDWFPGKGSRPWYLYGRRNKNKPSLRVTDARLQVGLYILYGDYGAHYVGLAKSGRGIGGRLKDHLSDEHDGRWNRFSWFGFRRVLEAQDGRGIRQMAKVARVTLGDPALAIKDMEALLIKALGVSNIADMRFQNADKWIQVRAEEAETYLEKIRP